MLRSAPVTRRGWAAFYDQKAEPGSQACALSTWYLLLVVAFGDHE